MIFYDFEVFSRDWLIVAIDDTAGPDGGMTVIHNDRNALKKFFSAHRGDVWTGYNSTHYDQFILRGIMSGADPKIINDRIIKRHESGWSICSPSMKRIPLISYDCKVTRAESLKQLEAFSGRAIHETPISFDIERALTDEELKEVISYCTDDVKMTADVFKARRAEYDASMYFIDKYGMNPRFYLSRTKAQLAAALLCGNYKGPSYNDEFDFPILTCLDIRKYRHVVEWFRSPSSRYYWDYDEKKGHKVRKVPSYKPMIAGCPATFRWGGLHASIDGFHGKGCFMIIDVTSYYPSLMKAYKFGYRVFDNPDNFLFIHDSNLEYKAAGDKKARQPFKIMDNAIFGQLKQSGIDKRGRKNGKPSSIFDPMNANAICVNGQLLLLDLIEHIEDHAKLIQANTDGIILQVNPAEIDTIKNIVAEWEKRTLMRMETEVFSDGEIWQKGVNHYLLLDRASGKIKSKGPDVKQLNPLDNNIPIINKAIKALMIDRIPIADTINNSTDLMDFQIVCKLEGARYTSLHLGMFEPSENQRKTAKAPIKDLGSMPERCARIFASTDTDAPMLCKYDAQKAPPKLKKAKKARKKKAVDVPGTVLLDGMIQSEAASGASVPSAPSTPGGLMQFPNTPDHIFIDNGNVIGKSIPAFLDRGYYIKAAEDAARGYFRPGKGSSTADDEDEED